MTDNDIDPSQWCVFARPVEWNDLPVHPEQGCRDNETTIDNQCDEICVFSGTQSTDCDGPGEISLGAGPTECDATTTSLAPDGDYNGGHVPPAASSDSSRMKLPSLRLLVWLLGPFAFWH